MKNYLKYLCVCFKWLVSFGVLLFMGFNRSLDAENLRVEDAQTHRETLLIDSNNPLKKRLIDEAVNNSCFIEAICCLHDTRELFFRAFEAQDCGWCGWEPEFWNQVRDDATANLLNLLCEEWSQLPEPEVDLIFRKMEDWSSITSEFYRLEEGLRDEEERFMLFYDEKYTKEAYGNSYTGKMTWDDWGDGIFIASFSHGISTCEGSSYWAELVNAIVQLDDVERRDYFERARIRIRHFITENEARWAREKIHEVQFTIESSEPVYVYVTQQKDNAILFSGILDATRIKKIVSHESGIKVACDKAEFLKIKKEMKPLKLGQQVKGKMMLVID